MVQLMMQSRPFDSELITLERTLIKEYAELLQAEETLYKAKPRVLWLNKGEKNTSFFIER